MPLAAMPTLGERIVTLRRLLGLSQAELARRIGIAQPSLHSIEHDKTRSLKGETLTGLARELGIDADELLGHRPMTDPHEHELVALWRVMRETDRENLLGIARALARRPEH